jgi:hypothetical protein
MRLIIKYDYGPKNVPSGRFPGCGKPPLVASAFYAFHMGNKSQFLTVSVKWFKATKDILSNVSKIGVPVLILCRN